MRLILLLLLLVACDEMNGAADARRRQEEADRIWNGPCADTAVLLASTAGSPDRATCSNKAHHMRVQVATTSSNEEIGALVFCECERDAGVGD